jgi:hypothetical protein
MLGDRTEALVYILAHELRHIASAIRVRRTLQLPRGPGQERTGPLFGSLHRGVRDSQAAGEETGERC